MARREVAAMDKDLPLFNVRTMDQAVATSVASGRFVMLLDASNLSLTLGTLSKAACVLGRKIKIEWVPAKSVSCLGLRGPRDLQAAIAENGNGPLTIQRCWTSPVLMSSVHSFGSGSHSLPSMISTGIQT